MRGRLIRRSGLNSALLSLALLAGTLTVGVVAAGPAQAAGGSCTGSVSGGTVTGGAGVSGGTITLGETVHFLEAHYCQGSSTSNDSSWTPPACWWAPVFDPQGMKNYAYTNYASSSSVDLTWEKLVQYYETDGGLGESRPPGYKSSDGPPYSDWNIGATPTGTWWSIVFNADMVGTPQFNTCLNETMDSRGMPWTWVPQGDPAPAANQAGVVTERDIAEYAASKVELPASDFSSDPTARQTVNLPMWVWAGNAGAGAGPYAPVGLTACVQDLNGNVYLCATVKATAKQFTIDPGTPNDAADAVVYDQGCTITAKGTVGTPYNGQKGLPGCGVTYLHSTANGVPYKPSVTVRWSVTWNGGGGPDWPKTDVMPGNDHPMNVQEIQTIVGH